MSRDISSSLLTALSSGSIQPYFAVELLFDSGPLRLWTGLGPKTINVRGSDQSFTGTGSLLSIGELEEVGDLSAKSLTLSLTGVDSSVVSLALQEPYQRRNCRLYFGEQSVADVVEVFSGKMDTMRLTDEPDSSTVELRIESNLIELEDSSNWRYTNENHQSRYSGDTFFSYVSAIQDQQVAWGRSTA